MQTPQRMAPPRSYRTREIHRPGKRGLAAETHRTGVELPKPLRGYDPLTELAADVNVNPFEGDIGRVCIFTEQTPGLGKRNAELRR